MSEAEAVPQRKVLRRRALQEFYNLENKSKESSPDRPSDLAESPLVEPSTDEPIRKIDDVAKFVRTAPIEEILAARNEITTKLNSQELEKKSIIYDNYYELIKLSETLTTLTTPSAALKQRGDLLVKLSDPLVDDDHLDKALADLETFVSESLVLGRKFDEIIGANDDAASITTIRERPEDTEVVKEIDYVLSQQRNKELAHKLALVPAGNPLSKFELDQLRKKLDA